MEPPHVASPSTVSDVPTGETIHYLHSIALRLSTYIQTQASDDTVFLIETMYKHLPQDGQHNLCE